jgi:cytosine/adenosine deaminase-related metal-dependent hydrolase
MILDNIRIVGHGPTPESLRISNEHIDSIAGPGFSGYEGDRIVFENAIAFPGLINSHDHLDFNLFPRLGRGPYQNYREWGSDIHRNSRGEIERVRYIPAPVRVRWGMYKNLIAGVTTVVNHGLPLLIEQPLIDVFQRYHFIHSVGFEKRWKWKLNRPTRNGFPCVMHIGEGIDDLSNKEIDSCIRWNFFKKDVIAVHGVAMSCSQAPHFKGLVWCPDSNFFLFNKTAAIEELKAHVPVMIGTDSTLTSNWDIWEQLRIALGTGKLSRKELYDTVTTTPAAVWQLPDRGVLKPGYLADIVVARADAADALDRFFKLKPEDILLVMRRGKILLCDESLAPQLQQVSGFSRFHINGIAKRCAGNLSGLVSEIRHHYAGIHLPVVI